MPDLDDLSDAAGDPLLDTMGAFIEDETDVLLDAGCTPLLDDAGGEIGADP